MKFLNVFLVLLVAFISKETIAQKQKSSSTFSFIYSSKDYYIDSEKQIIVRKVAGRELPEPFNISEKQLSAIDRLLNEINFTNYPKNLTVKNSSEYQGLLIVSAKCDNEITFSVRSNKKRKEVRWNDCIYKPEHESHINNLQKLHEKILKLIMSPTG